MSVALGEAAMFENGTLYRHLYASLWGSQTIQRMRVVFPAGDGPVDIAATLAAGGLRPFVGMAASGPPPYAGARFRDSPNASLALFNGVSELEVGSRYLYAADQNNYRIRFLLLSLILPLAHLSRHMTLAYIQARRPPDPRRGHCAGRRP